MMPQEKQRLDVLVHEQGLAPSREMAQRYILAGEVTVDGVLQTKPGTKVSTTAEIVLKQAAPFVSRGGEKLEGALATFGLDVKGWCCADVGASTGGFTDCLLQRGATKVYALDVGYGQLAHKLRIDPRVVSMERTNVRYQETLDEPIRLVVMDVSFISILLLLPTIRGWLTPDGEIVTLIKPQFEAGKADVGKGGIVKDTEVHRRVLNDILTQAQAMGYTVRGLVQSSITGSKGNIEFLAWLGLGTSIADLTPLIEAVL
ncbi:MAG: TlyA family RNA methyltransferase [Anaerolineales bacterium]|nr:TlyA family RNA methyltransferase [Anaerolineales bacterium]